MSLPRGNVIGDDEILYHGSDDEDYPDPQTRQLRYRSAGERYLDGDIPFLLSASLHGPLDSTSGWINPWKSRQRCESYRISSATFDSSQRQPTTILVSRPGGESMADSHQCHLPSPESLRQAPVSEPHLFLQGQGLDMIQRWRQDIQPPSLTQDSFWASTNAQKNSSAKKRRATESAWLKRRTEKKRKPNFAGRQKSSTLRSRDGGHSSPVLESCSSAFEASSPCGPRLVDSNNLIGQNELFTSTANAVCDGISEQPTPSKKTTFPKQCILSSANSRIGGVAHQSRKNDAAVASPSSPISRRSTITAYALEVNRRKKRSPPPVTAEASLITEEESDGGTTASDGDGWRQDACGKASNETCCRLQTQHDQSFCFKIRLAAEDAPEDRLLTVEPILQPESPALAKSSSQCRPPAIELPDVRSLEKTTTQTLSDDDLARTDEDGRSTKEDEQSGRSKSQSPETSEVACDSLDHAELAGDRSEAEKASSAMSLEDNTLFTAPPESNPVREELVTQCEHHDDEETARANNITPPPATAQHSIAANQQKGHDSELTPGPEEALESGPRLNGSRSALLPNRQSNSPTRPRQTNLTSPTDGTPRGYSLTLLLNHLVPTSPWAKLSQLTRSSGSTAILLSQGALAITSASREEGAEQCEEGEDETKEEGAEGGEVVVDSGSTISCARLASPKQDRPSEDSNPEKDIDMSETEAVAESKQALISASQQSPWVRHTPLTNTKIVSSEQAMGDTDTEMSECEEVEENDGRVTDSQQSPWTALLSSTNPEQHRAADNGVSDEDLEMNAGQEGEPQEAASQQSPWMETQSREPLSRTATRHTSPARLSNQPSSGEDQSSWNYHVGTETASMPAFGLVSSSSCAVVTGLQPQFPRPHTPEPQFAVKPFASFMTPSPERRTRALRSRACTMSGLASALKNPWSGNSSRPDRRVSWASPPLQKQSQDDEEHAPASSSSPLSSAAASTPLHSSSAPRSKARQVSPPPPLNNNSLPSSTKFCRHFAAAASRRRSLPTFTSSPVLPRNTSELRLIPTASQQGRSPGPRAMAEAFLAADDAVTSEQQQPPQQNAPLDGNGGGGVVDDLLRDMGDFLFALDVDAELDQAREDPHADARQPQAAAYQSPW